MVMVRRKFLAVGLLAQRLSAFIILISTADFSPNLNAIDGLFLEKLSPMTGKGSEEIP